MKPCEICGPQNISKVNVLYETGDFEVLRCSECTLVYVNETPRIAKGKGIPAAYREVRAGMDWYLEHAAAEELKSVEALTGKERGRLLDVGCGTGEFLKAATAAGWEAAGVDLDKAAVDIARDTYGVNATWSTLEEANLPERQFDVITLYNIIEHVPHPLSFLKRINKLMRTNGHVIVETPLEGNVATHIARLLYRSTRGRVRFHIKYLYSSTTHGGHIYRFSRETLTNIMEKAGFTVESYQAVSTSIRFFIRKRNVGKPVAVRLFHYCVFGVAFPVLTLMFGSNRFMVSARKQSAAT